MEKRVIVNLQILRALAFLSIFISHSRLSPWGGALGVSIFFVLSGFLMVYSYRNRNLPANFVDSFKFSIGKIKKLYLLHIIMMAVAVPYEIYRIGIGSVSQFVLKIVCSLLLIQSWIPDFNYYGSFNGVAWFLSATMFLYFVFPFVKKLIDAYKNISVPIVISISVYLLMFSFAFLNRDTFIVSDYPDNCYWFAYTLPLFRFGDFFIGANLGYIFLKKGKFSSNIIINIIQVLTLALCAFSAVLYSSGTIFGEPWFKYTLLWIPSSVLLVYLFATEQGLFAIFKNNKFLYYLGNISPYTFLIHEMNILYIAIIAGKVFGSLITNGIAEIGYLVVLSLISFMLTLLETHVFLAVFKKKKQTIV